MGFSITNLNETFRFLKYSILKDSLFFGKKFGKRNIFFFLNEFFIKISNRETHDSFITNLKGVTIIWTQVQCLLSFDNTLREGNVIFPT